MDTTDALALNLSSLMAADRCQPPLAYQSMQPASHETYAPSFAHDSTLDAYGFAGVHGLEKAGGLGGSVLSVSVAGRGCMAPSANMSFLAQPQQLQLHQQPQQLQLHHSQQLQLHQPQQLVSQLSSLSAEGGMMMVPQQRLGKAGPGSTWFSFDTAPPHARPGVVTTNAMLPHATGMATNAMLPHATKANAMLPHATGRATNANTMLLHAMAVEDARATSSSLYVKNLPPEFDELALYQTFSPFGALMGCKVPIDTMTGKCKGVGFVNFLERDSAVRAVAQLHGFCMGEGRYMHVEIQAPRAVRPRPALQPPGGGDGLGCGPLHPNQQNGGASYLLFRAV